MRPKLVSSPVEKRREGRIKKIKERVVKMQVNFNDEYSELNVPELPLPITIDNYGEENVGDVYIVDIDDETWEVTITVEKGRE